MTHHAAVLLPVCHAPHGGLWFQRGDFVDRIPDCPWLLRARASALEQKARRWREGAFRHLGGYLEAIEAAEGAEDLARDYRALADQITAATPVRDLTTTSFPDTSANSLGGRDQPPKRN